MTKSTITPNIEQRVQALYQRVSSYIDHAKERVQQSIDIEMVKAYWLTGRDIVQEEQQGETRAKYGTALLQELSEKLTQKYQRGFSVSTLKDIRRFYVEYQLVIEKPQKGHALRVQLEQTELPFSPQLSWTHYRTLMRIKQLEARNFYEKESITNRWGTRELERQIGALLFERLSMSKDKKEIMQLATQGQEINTPEDAIKEPVVLEFLGLPESHKLVESKIEEALINNLQDFLLEMGKGFSFIGRQKRLSFDNDHFYADLVFYHVILKCYVIIDIKTHKLKHGDLGQMLLYVNYFDKEIKREDDNPTIGLILCTEKSDMMVKYLLDDKSKQIFASKYQFHLPTEKQLEQELKRELKQIKHELGEDEQETE